MGKELAVSANFDVSAKPESNTALYDDLIEFLGVDPESIPDHWREPIEDFGFMGLSPAGEGFVERQKFFKPLLDEKRKELLVKDFGKLEDRKFLVKLMRADQALICFYSYSGNSCDNFGGLESADMIEMFGCIDPDTDNVFRFQRTLTRFLKKIVEQKGETEARDRFDELVKEGVLAQNAQFPDSFFALVGPHNWVNEDQIDGFLDGLISLERTNAFLLQSDIVPIDLRRHHDNLASFIRSEYAKRYYNFEEGRADDEKRAYKTDLIGRVVRAIFVSPNHYSHILAFRSIDTDGQIASKIANLIHERIFANKDSFYNKGFYLNDEQKREKRYVSDMIGCLYRDYPEIFSANEKGMELLSICANKPPEQLNKKYVAMAGSHLWGNYSTTPELITRRQRNIINAVEVGDKEVPKGFRERLVIGFSALVFGN